MTTYVQNVCLVTETGDTWTHVQERPVCPVDITLHPEWVQAFDEDSRYYGVFKDGVLYKWYVDGKIEMYDNGILWIICYPKPTLDHIVHSPNGEMFVQFHQDGNVEMKHDGRLYFWGPEIPGTPINGRGGWQFDVGHYRGVPPHYMFA
jgi:hypothetical protein